MKNGTVDEEIEVMLNHVAEDSYTKELVHLSELTKGVLGSDPRPELYNILLKPWHESYGDGIILLVVISGLVKAGADPQAVSDAYYLLTGKTTCRFHHSLKDVIPVEGGSDETE